MSVFDDFDLILDYAHMWNWVPDWYLAQSIYKKFPESYSILTPFAYSYLEEMIRTTTSDYELPLFDRDKQPVKVSVGMALIALAIKENQNNPDYVALLEQAKRHFKQYIHLQPDISQAYITKVLKTTNELAIIIMLDIVHSSGQENVAAILQQRKNLHNYLKSEDTNEKGTPNSLMWTSHWLLAYESTKNQWLKLPGIPFEYAKKNRFFNELLNRNVKFYNPGFSYSNPPNKFHNPEFATRSELYNALRKMKKSILEQLEGAGLETPSSLTPEEEDLFSKFIEALQADETIY
jgi:hypothetical protein